MPGTIVGMRRLFNFMCRPVVSLWGTIGILVVYPLSAGPFVWLIWNVRLPDWAALGILFFFQPFGWVVKKSEICSELWFRYAQLWVNITNGQTATDVRLDIPLPPFFVEFTGSLVGAWLIWNFVRWVNQQKTPRLAATPQGAP